MLQISSESPERQRICCTILGIITETTKKMCEFGEFLDQEFCDKLVCGIQNETIQRRLLTEKELTAARAYELARGMEAAYQQSTQLQTAQQEQKA